LALTFGFVIVVPVGGGVLPCASAKLAVTSWAEFIATVHVAEVPVQAPDQLLNVDPLAGVAVRRTLVPAVNAFQHAPGQSIDDPVTVPWPLPRAPTVRVNVWGDRG
jgi:hypothetical protein